MPKREIGKRSTLTKVTKVEKIPQMAQGVSLNADYKIGLQQPRLEQSKVQRLPCEGVHASAWKRSALL